MKHTVHTLRLSGHKVRVIHFRYGQVDFYNFFGHIKGETFGPAYQLRNLDAVIEPLHGETVVQMTFPDGSEAEGICVQTGNYNKKLGVEKCLDAIFTKAGIDRDVPETYPIVKRWIGVPYCNNETHGELVVLFNAPREGTVIGAGGFNATQFGTHNKDWNEVEFESLPNKVGVAIYNTDL